MIDHNEINLMYLLYLERIVFARSLTLEGPWCGCSGLGWWRRGWGWRPSNTWRRRRSTCHRTVHRTPSSQEDRWLRRRSWRAPRRRGRRWRGRRGRGCRCGVVPGPCRWRRTPGCCRIWRWKWASTGILLKIKFVLGEF